MSGYLTWLADELRNAGLRVVEQDGWQKRARGSGGFSDGRPLCVMWHHTASDTTAANDASYCSYGSPDAPITNLLIDGDGTVWVCAAGATNTNGKGGALHASRGTIPADSMNTCAVGMEICNSGVGETYPRAQIDAAFAASNAINARCGNRPTDAFTHYEYAPDRKIDPATAAAAAASGWQPRSISSSGTWNDDDLRGECLRRSTTDTGDIFTVAQFDEIMKRFDAIDKRLRDQDTRSSNRYDWAVDNRNWFQNMDRTILGAVNDGFAALDVDTSASDERVAEIDAQLGDDPD